MRISRREAKRASVKGATINGGQPMRLRIPFDTLAVYEGAIHLTSSVDSLLVLRVPGDARAYLSGVIADNEVAA